MSALRSVVLDWDADRVVRLLVSAGAGYLAIRVADGLLAQLGAVVLFAVVLMLPWEGAKRLVDRSRDE